MKPVAIFALAALVLAVASTASAATAEENYRTHCLKCHGVSGRGDGPAADVLDVPAGDFTDCEHMNQVSDDYLLTIIRNGGEAVGRSSQMPGAAKIPEEEIPALVEYVRSFCKEAAPAGAKAAASPTE
ncbi:MAG: cytochrome c [Candidatus Dadabacteria bacterium]|nr:MAG: cytochrome c [Candidatus Dadabacteria bacterium]